VPKCLIIVQFSSVDGCLHTPLPGDKSDPSDQAFPCLLEVQTNHIFILTGRPYPKNQP